MGDSKDTTRKPDFDKIIKNIQRLNAVASQSKIIQTTTGAKFESPREIKIGFYSNGILLRGNDFREYSKISTNIFLQDLEDGYFPSELQNEFPEGVPFEVLFNPQRTQTNNFTVINNLIFFFFFYHYIRSTIEEMKIMKNLKLNFSKVTVEDWDRILKTNLLQSFY